MAGASLIMSKAAGLSLLRINSGLSSLPTPTTAATTAGPGSGNNNRLRFGNTNFNNEELGSESDSYEDQDEFDMENLNQLLQMTSRPDGELEDHENSSSALNLKSSSDVEMETQKNQDDLEDIDMLDLDALELENLALMREAEKLMRNSRGSEGSHYQGKPESSSSNDRENQIQKQKVEPVPDTPDGRKSVDSAVADLLKDSEPVSQSDGEEGKEEENNSQEEDLEDEEDELIELESVDNLMNQILECGNNGGNEEEDEEEDDELEEGEGDEWSPEDENDGGNQSGNRQGPPSISKANSIGSSSSTANFGPGAGRCYSSAVSNTGTVGKSAARSTATGGLKFSSTTRNSNNWNNCNTTTNYSNSREGQHESRPPPSNPRSSGNNRYNESLLNELSDEEDHNNQDIDVEEEEEQSFDLDKLLGNVEGQHEAPPPVGSDNESFLDAEDDNEDGFAEAKEEDQDDEMQATATLNINEEGTNKGKSLNSISNSSTSKGTVAAAAPVPAVTVSVPPIPMAASPIRAPKTTVTDDEKSAKSDDVSMVDAAECSPESSPDFTIGRSSTSASTAVLGLTGIGSVVQNLDQSMNSSNSIMSSMSHQPTVNLSHSNLTNVSMSNISSPPQKPQTSGNEQLQVPVQQFQQSTLQTLGLPPHKSQQAKNQISSSSTLTNSQKKKKKSSAPAPGAPTPAPSPQMHPQPTPTSTSLGFTKLDPISLCTVTETITQNSMSVIEAVRPIAGAKKPSPIANKVERHLRQSMASAKSFGGENNDGENNDSTMGTEQVEGPESGYSSNLNSPS